MKTFSRIFLFVLLPVLAVMLTAGVVFHFFGRRAAETSAAAQLASSASLTARLVDDHVQRIGDSLSTLLAQEAISNYFMFLAAGLRDDAENNRLEVEHSFVRLAELGKNIERIELYSGEGQRLVAVIDGIRTLAPREVDREDWFQSTRRDHGHAVFADRGDMRVSRVAIDENESTPSAIATVLLDFESGASASAAFATQYLPRSRVTIQGAGAAAAFVYGEAITDDFLEATAPISTLEGSVTVRQARSAALASFHQSETILFAALSLVTLGLLVMIAVGTNLVLRNIREAQRAAELANTAKSEFLANMSHELRTPMNAIIGYSEMLLEDAEDEGNEEVCGDLKKILGAGKHLLALINDVLDLSKIEAGKMEVYVEDFEIGALIDDVVATTQALVKKNDNQLRVEVDASLGQMRADLTKVRQALFNLLSNASKFTHDGEIGLVVEPEAVGGVDWVRMTVSDNGIGIPAEKLDHVFEEFSQAEVSTSRDYGGTGLGLPISRRFCRMMGGDITVESRSGEGSAFTIRLPLRVTSDASPVPAPDADVAAATVPAESGEVKTVLVIDDDPNALDLLGRTLQGAGARVVTASGGQEALRLAKTLRPAAITLDVLMPEMDGWEVLRELKRDPETRDIPVIMVTMTDDREKGYALGATEFLTKPIDRGRLTQLLECYALAGAERRALVVDDQSANRDMLRRALEKEGWQVDDAENGRAALERVADRRPSLILLDLMMPVMDGFAFVTELRKTEAWRAIPIVVVTAKDLTDEDRRRLSGEVVGLIQKNGTDRESLLAQIREHVAAAGG
jgi:signal transduction histidine kinase/DNA-binding response OmpR family regulator